MYLEHLDGGLGLEREHGLLLDALLHLELALLLRLLELVRRGLHLRERRGGPTVYWCSSEVAQVEKPVVA